MNNAQTAPKIKKETKNTIKVDFEDRTPFWDRVKAKLVNLYTLKKVIYYIHVQGRLRGRDGGPGSEAPEP